MACAWDGQTYIIDHNRTVVRFQFDENVNAFCAGDANVSPGGCRLNTLPSSACLKNRWKGRSYGSLSLVLDVAGGQMSTTRWHC